VGHRARPDPGLRPRPQVARPDLAVRAFRARAQAMNTAMYRANRERALAQLRERRAAAVIPTARAKVKNHDTEFRFRPDSDFWWLTGFDEPDSVLVLLPALDGQAKDRSLLFLRDKKREEEVWTGTRL